MKRWSEIKFCEVENPKADSFVEDLIEVFKKHGLSLSHEDSHGAFIIENYSESNVEWLKDALDRILGD